MNYQEIFQSLKGVTRPDLSSLCLPILGTQYHLAPIRCAASTLDYNVVKMLTVARNANTRSFLTTFEANDDRTANWLMHNVASDPTRILFALRSGDPIELYGYMGLAYADPTGTRIEGDAIVRSSGRVEKGLMGKAFLRLVDWAKFDLGFEDVWIRVLSDNPAIDFYRKCGFVPVKEVPLFEIRGADGSLEALTEQSEARMAGKSKRTLTHMRYSK